MKNFEDYFDSVEPIPSVVSKQSGLRTSFLSMKYFYVLGCLTGNMPFRGLFSAKSSMNITFKKLSLPFFLSWIILGVKLCIFGELTRVNHSGMRNESGPPPPPPESKAFGPPSFTDIIAGQAEYMIHGAYGILSSAVFILSANNFLVLLQQVESYEESYLSKKHTPVLNIWVLVAILCSIYDATDACAPIYSYLNSPFVSPVYLFNLVPLGSSLVTGIVYTFGTFFIEYGVILLNIQFLYLSNVLSSKLTDFIQDVEGLSEIKTVFRHSGASLTENLKTRSTNLDLGKLQAWLGSDGIGFESQTRSWGSFGERYIKLERIFKTYEKFAGPILIVMFIALIASTIFTIYMGTSNPPPGMDEFLNKALQLVSCGIACFRLYSITNIGETFQQKYDDLVKTTLRIGQMRNRLQETERDEFDQFSKLVSNVRLNLSAAGFFNVHRGNITSIVSVVITYIIVLIQFRQSEDPKED